MYISWLTMISILYSHFCRYIYIVQLRCFVCNVVFHVVFCGYFDSSTGSYIRGRHVGGIWPSSSICLIIFLLAPAEMWASRSDLLLLLLLPLLLPPVSPGLKSHWAALKLQCRAWKRRSRSQQTHADRRADGQTVAAAQLPGPRRGRFSSAAPHARLADSKLSAPRVRFGISPHCFVEVSECHALPADPPLASPWD